MSAHEMVPARGVLNFLGGLPYFAGIPAAKLGGLAARSLFKRLARAQVLIHPGEHPDRLWFISSGLIRVASHAPGGESLTIDLRRTGEGLCYRSLLSKAACPFEASALVDSVVVGVPLGRYLDLLKEHPGILRAFMEDLSANLVESQGMRSLAIETSRRRVLRVMLWLQEKLGRVLPLNRQGIAEAAGVSRETAIRVLSPLEKKGWLHSDRGVVEILRPEKLREQFASG